MAYPSVMAGIPQARASAHMAPFGVVNSGSRVEPLDRQLVLGIRELRSCFARARALAVLVVAVPRDVDHAADLVAHGVEGGIVEPFADAALRRRFRRNHQLPDGIEHLWIESTTGNLTGRGCPDARLVPFISGSEPVQRSNCAAGLYQIRDWFQELFN